MGFFLNKETGVSNSNNSNSTFIELNLQLLTDSKIQLLTDSKMHNARKHNNKKKCCKDVISSPYVGAQCTK